MDRIDRLNRDALKMARRVLGDLGRIGYKVDDIQRLARKGGFASLEYYAEKTQKKVINAHNAAIVMARALDDLLGA